jgi:hypothetical protein
MDEWKEHVEISCTGPDIRGSPNSTDMENKKVQEGEWINGTGWHI